MNEIVMDDLITQMEGNFLTPDFSFADEEPVVKSVEKDEDLTVPLDGGDGDVSEMSLEDFTKMMFDEEDEIIDEAADLIEKDVIPFDDGEESFYDIDGIEYASGDIKAAVKAREAMKSFDAQVNHYREGMSKLADEFARSEFMNNSVLDEAVEHWYSKMNESKTTEEFKYNQHNYQSAVDRREAGKARFEKFNRELQAGREEQQRIEAQHIVNELLYSHSWAMDDFAEVNRFIEENGIDIKPAQASAKLLIALKKAALYDNQRKTKESELRQKAKVKPLTNSPVNASNLDTIASKQDNSSRRKAEKKLAAGMADYRDLDFFNNLSD